MPENATEERKRLLELYGAKLVFSPPDEGSNGAVLHVARRLGEELDEGVVVAVLPDGGWKYVSADFWEATDVEAAMEHTVWW